MTPTRSQILLVDDEIELAELTADALRGEGLDVHLAHDGYRALGMLTVHRYDAIVTDLMMPEMTGLQLVSHVRATDRHANCPIFILSGNADERAIAKLKNLRVAEVLAKPISVDVLAALIKKSLKPLGRKPLAYAPGLVEMVADCTTEILEYYCDGRPVADAGLLKENSSAPGVASATISLYGRKVYGSLGLGVDQKLLELLTEKVFGIKPTEWSPSNAATFHEVVGEMLNQVAGSLKVKLRNQRILINIGLPEVFHSQPFIHRIAARVLQVPLRLGAMEAHVELCLGNSLVDELVNEDPAFSVFIADRAA